MNIGDFLRRNGVGIVMIGGLLTVGGLIIYPFFASARYHARRSVCLSNLKFIAMACQQYSADYGGFYPPLSDGGSRGWSVLLQRGQAKLDSDFDTSDRLKALEKGEILFNLSCPEGTDYSFSPTSDYFFNAQLATRKEASVRQPNLTICFGEGPDNGPSNSHYWELPNDDENPESVLRRHDRYSNYAFADGHVKMIRAKILREGYEPTHPKPLFRFAPDDGSSGKHR